MRHDKPPFIAAIDQFGSRVLVRAGKNFNGFKATVTVDEGKQIASGKLQQGELHLALPGTLPDTYSMALTLTKPREKAAPVTPPVEPETRPTDVATDLPVDPVTNE